MQRRPPHLLVLVHQFNLVACAQAAHHSEHADTQAHQKPQTAAAPGHRHASDPDPLRLPFSLLTSGRLSNGKIQTACQLPNEQDAVDSKASSARLFAIDQIAQLVRIAESVVQSGVRRALHKSLATERISIEHVVQCDPSDAPTLSSEPQQLWRQFWCQL